MIFVSSDSTQCQKVERLPQHYPLPRNRQAGLVLGEKSLANCIYTIQALVKSLFAQRLVFLAIFLRYAQSYILDLAKEKPQVEGSAWQNPSKSMKPI